ncbi:hypothetical protein, variant 1 [Aphanomyces invadans]|uniref:Alpha-ketoglutarate-dependent dioxygenase FTO n=1 Tax=Aphanomyces invadans TaxID=157072 RepID=A0A024TSQ8_9STRA|nr:hypothetical protein H310_09862 [Aphanomyces invadans]XP_008874275.1 hypothetical protein, variant 1 [Aphanomyces invadans]ETV97028.1 hypothetical protein H310_09862 [Aphanomyces invadans]ETV97029.1 hypothetical protein, variant 1 [Aphanomyces invadans]|eukprot:XP_008874274.1 hypothetical protein H310_09862 [Aphanomyces invadans]
MDPKERKKLERQKKKAKAQQRKSSKLSNAIPPMPVAKQATNAGNSTSMSQKRPSENAPQCAAAPPTKKQQVKQAKALPIASNYTGPEKFLTPSHPSFHDILTRSYVGFVHEPAAKHPRGFHTGMRTAFETLRDKGYFQYDVVMAGGKHLSRTFVRRTLVGNYGITYKYLGLRIFAHAWDRPNSAPVFRNIHALNAAFIARTKASMTPPPPSCEYNLTLINYMEPDNPLLGLKEDPTYGMGKVSVSWHADSSLEDYSSIGVYHTLLPSKPAKKGTKVGVCDWRIAMRLSPDVPGAKTTPPLVLPTGDGDVYYLNGDFNHFHQHMVLSGTAVRVSSTHRVAVTAEDTLQFIQAKVSAALQSSTVQSVPNDADVACRRGHADAVRAEQATITTLEMEWIRQYWIQGAKHNDLHVDWQHPMAALEASWRKLEARTKTLVGALLATQHVEDLKVVKAVLEGLRGRQAGRDQFVHRMRDKVFKRIDPDFQPMERPVWSDWDDRHLLPKDLTSTIHALHSHKHVLEAEKKRQWKDHAKQHKKQLHA